MDLAKITRLRPEQFLEPAIAEEVLALGEIICEQVSGPEAMRLLQILWPIFGTSAGASALELNYQALLAKLRFIAIPFLSDSEVIEVLRISVVASLKREDFELWFRNAIKNKMIAFPATLRDGYKEQLRKALHENQERLTAKYIVTEGREISPTVGNWLSDYIRFVGGGEVSNLQQAEYLASRRSLDEQDRSTLKKLIQLYEYLKFSSLTPKGIEEMVSGYDETRGKWYFLNAQGVAEELEDIPPPPWAVPTPAVPASPVATRPASLLEDLKAILAQEAQATAELKKQGEAVWQALGGERAKILAASYDLLVPLPGAKANPVKAQGLLAALASRGILDELVEEKRLRAALEQYLREQRRNHDLEALRLTPRAPHALGVMLQFVLEEKLRLNEPEAARFAARLTSLMKQAGRPQYVGMTYFDQASWAFRWKT